MTKTLKWLPLFLIAALSIGFTSCEDDDNNSFIDNPEGNKENISKPTIKKNIFSSNYYRFGCCISGE